MIDAYQLSDRFKALSPDYLRVIRRHLMAIRDQADDARAAHFKAQHIKADLAPLVPYVAATRFKAWRLLCAFGTEAGMLKADISEGIKRKPVPKTDGHPTWTPEHIAVYREFWTIATVQRLCFELLYWSGFRIGDAVAVGDGMVGKDGVLAFRQRKTGGEAFVPWTCPLPSYATNMALDRELMHQALSARPSRHMTFLATAQGKTRSSNELGMLIGEAARCKTVRNF